MKQTGSIPSNYQPPSNTQTWWNSLVACTHPRFYSRIQAARTESRRPSLHAHARMRGRARRTRHPVGPAALMLSSRLFSWRLVSGRTSVCTNGFALQLHHSRLAGALMSTWWITSIDTAAFPIAWLDLEPPPPRTLPYPTLPHSTSLPHFTLPRPTPTPTYLKKANSHN